MNLFSETSENIIISHTLLDSLDYIFVTDSMGLSSTTTTKVSPQADKFNRIMQNKRPLHRLRSLCHQFWYQSKVHKQLPISD